MSIVTSGTVNFSDLRLVFKGVTAGSISMSELYSNGVNASGISGIPASGNVITVAHFRGKSKVVSLWGKSVPSGGTMWVAVGLYGTHSIMYSNNGTSWTGITGSSIFNEGWGIAWNGSMWVAVGRGTNTIAYSYDGTTWTGLGQIIFTRGKGIAWNGNMWVAVGEGTNTIAYSYNGINWTGRGSSIFSSVGSSVAWNGTRWVAVGYDTNAFAYSNDGINWVGLGTSVMYMGFGITWAPSLNLWVAAGGYTNNTLAYSSDGINWYGLGTSTLGSSYGFCVLWNGTMFLAGGNNSNGNVMAYSYNGYSWSGLGNGIFSNQCRSFGWNGSLWVAGGFRDGTGNAWAYSSNGINWTVINPPINYGMGVTSNAIPQDKLYSFTSFTFTNAGASGRNGPSLGQIQSSYSSTSWTQNTSYLNMTTQGIQRWTVPETRSYTFIVCGAHGAMGTGSTTGSRGGRGVFITSTFNLTHGDILYLIVGQAGSYDTGNGGGGGASVVYNSTTNTLLYIAGGGGGTRQYASVNGTDASIYQYGLTSSSSSANNSNTYNNTTYTYNGRTATLGYGGVEGNPSGYGDSGAGWLGDGSDDSTTSTVAVALNSTAIGGGSGQGGSGGFGGGGSGAGSNGGGGGGGYTGGNGGFIAGGGGSYTIASSTNTTISIDTLRSYDLNGSPVHGYIMIPGVILTSPSFNNGTYSTNGTMWVIGGYGPSNTMAYSTNNGVSWTSLGIYIDSTCYGLVYGNNKWVAIGQGGSNNYATSSNGTSWSYYYSSNIGIGWGIGYGNNMFVSVVNGRNGRSDIMYSSDGLNWTATNTYIGGYLNAGVVWNGAIWVVVSGTVIAYSYDAIVWIKIGASSSIFTTRGFDVAYSSSLSRWVAVGEGTNSIAYSNDGITWVGLGTSLLNGYGGYCVAWNGTMFIAGGGQSGPGGMAYSTDGMNWTTLSSGTTGLTGCLVISWNGTTWLAGGDINGTRATSYSTNGTSWTSSTSINSIIPYALRALSSNAVL